MGLFTYGQGVTTSSMSGKVTDSNGEALTAANIVAIHLPSGTQYGTITRDDGNWDIRNMRIGGPYEITVSYVGFNEEKQSDVYLNLNQTYEVQFVLVESIETLMEVTVTTGSKYINSDLTGSMTAIEKREIKSLPTIKRGLGDFTRLTPESDGNSFGGRNNLYNNFSVDGSIFNNPFGLDYATPGGQTDAQPVSLEAIDQIQVSLAPFDVREGGFTGAGVNAVTKSGTNEWTGNIYSYFRNEGMIGKKVGDVEVENLDFNTNLTGLSLGGPIIKNKLFFFMNVEGERRDELAHGFVADNGTNSGDNVTTVSETDVQAVRQHFLDEWGYETGEYQGYNHETYNDKLLFKIDWNINQTNTFTFRYNYLDSWKDILPHPEAIGGRGPTNFRLPFENSSYRIFNKINSYVAELNSRFGNNISNRLLVGYTEFRDHREPHSEPFPVIDILNTNGQVAITAGSEMFSTHNILDQNVLQITDNFTYFMDNHNITVGFNFEKFFFYNSFNLFYYPWYTFASVQDFLNASDELDPSDPNYYDFNQDVTNSQQNAYAEPELDVAQLAFYVQDEYKVNDNLKLTAGLRMDMPLYLNSIEQDPQITGFTGWVDEDGNAVTVDPSEFPKATPLWSPRLGFNWDVMGDNTLQVRGGSGIFTGRIPFVWLGNQSTNSFIAPGYTFQINATSTDFKWPQVWKTNIAVDKDFGEGLVATLDILYSKDINAVVHRNYNMLEPTGTLGGNTGDNRAIFAGFNEQNIYSSDANAATFLDAGVIVLDNTNEGSQFSTTGKVAKTFDFGLNATFAYTYMMSKDYTSIPAEIAADAFQRNAVVGDPNHPELSYSRYGLNHRLIASVTYVKEYGNMRTTVGAFFEAGKGNRYSYTYIGDINNDGIGTPFVPNYNDLIYVPKDQNDINFGTIDGNGDAVIATDAAAQWAALDAFIEQDPYLSERRGDYAERNGASLPWFTQFDIRIMQDFDFMIKDKKNTLQLSLDILNFGNMINSNWGVRQLPTTLNPLTFNGLDNNNVPYFSFNTNLTESYIDDVSIFSKWQMQIGVKYMFN